ncbi:MAG: hypothetical protein EBZ48_10605 [Proteobacteria bacterium]|nr:hypothetical protein [Pseudomonadota bacterium]
MGLLNSIRPSYFVPMTPKWTSTERKVLGKLSNPSKIQGYLDALPYNLDPITRSARGVMQRERAHCFDGAMFAAAALEQHGFPPLLMDLRANEEDDDHVLAIFRQHGRWGAIGKSNYTGCRFRDPIYRTLRELALSYFHIYFNLAGRRTLREYSVAFPLLRIRDVNWRTGCEDLAALGERLDAVRHFRLIDRRTEKLLSEADERTFKAETLGLDPRGAFKVKGARKPG